MSISDIKRQMKAHQGECFIFEFPNHIQLLSHIMQHGVRF